MGAVRTIGALCAFAAMLAAAPAAAAPGAFDPGFGGTGSVLLGPPLMAATSVAVQPDGRVVVGGIYANNGAPTWAVDRRNPDGSPDTTFGSAGRVDLAQEGAVVDTAVMPDGRIVLMGRTGANHIGLIRLMPAGTRDSGFGTNGFVYSPHSQERTFGLAIDPSGRPLVVGHEDGENGPELVVERFTADGRPDPSFGGDGVVSYKLHEGSAGNTGSTWGMDVEFDAQQRLVVSGQYNDLQPPGEGLYLFAGRLRDDGSPDPSWGNGGFAGAPAGTGTVDGGGVLAVLDGGRIAVIGKDTQGGATGVRIARFDPAGRPDEAWGPGGVRVYPLRDAEPRSTSQAAGGRTVVTGGGAYPDNAHLGWAMRLAPSGEIDPGWGVDGVATWPYPSGYNAGLDIAATADGGAVVVENVDPPDGYQGVARKLTGDGGGAPGGGGGSPGGGDAQPALVVGKPVMRGRRLLIRLRCTASTTCRGAIKATRGKRTIARKAFRIATGKSRRVALAMPRRRPPRVRLTLLLRKPVRDLATSTVRLR